MERSEAAEGAGDSVRKKKVATEAPKLEMTIAINQTVLADFQLMVDEFGRQCECEHPHHHTVSAYLEQIMIATLRAYEVAKAIRRYDNE